MENFEKGAIFIWTVEQFQDKLVDMKEALNVYETNARMEPEADPFNQKQEPIFLGQCFYSLEGLGYLMDNPHTLPVVGSDMKAIGELTMNVLPCYADGNEEIDEEQCPDDPSELLSQPMYFKVFISHATKLPENFCRDVYCEYKFYLDDTVYKTDVIEGKNTDPTFQYINQHNVECVTQSLLDYVANEKMQIKMYGIQDLKPRKPDQTAALKNA